MKKVIIALILLLLLSVSQQANAVVSLPSQLESTEITVYESADLTYVREFHNLSLAAGTNRFSFDWDKAQIDPTSLQLRVDESSTNVVKKELSFPPGNNETVIWELEASDAASARVEVSYFVTGLHWRPLYCGVLDDDETTLNLEGRIEIANNSPLELKKTKINLLMGDIHLLNKIAGVIKNWRQKRQGTAPRQRGTEQGMVSEARKLMAAAPQMDSADAAPRVESRELAEYRLLEIEGWHKLPAASQKIIAFTSGNFEADNLYRYRSRRGNSSPTRHLRFKNKPAEGEASALPAGLIRVVKQADDGNFTRINESRLNFVSPGEEALVELGKARDVRVKRVVMNRETLNYSFDAKKQVDGWTEREDVEIKVDNFRRIPVNVEVHQEFPHSYWEILRASHPHVKQAHNRIKTEFTLYPQETTRAYQLIRYDHGTRRDR